jgi:glutathione S-transferase
MDLYFSPLACSMASRITLYEADAPARFIEVDPKSKRLLDGQDFLAINPLGLVPTIRTDDGEVLTENAAILQYIADRFPGAKLSPRDGMGRSYLHQWLSFVGTELQKALFTPLFDPNTPEAVKARTLEKGNSRLSWLNTHLTGRDFLLEQFSVADAYLVTVLNWNIATPVNLGDWPAVKDYYVRLKHRPSVARALSEEHALYAAEQLRHRTA